MREQQPEGRVQTGRESGRDGYGVPHEPGVDTYGQARAGQGNWQDEGPAGLPEAPPAPDGPLGQGSEPMARGADAARPDQLPGGVGGAARPIRDAADRTPVLASGLSNYSRDSQYGNQGRYGTPAQYNEEPMTGGELQNGDHPADRPATGEPTTPHPNG